MPAYKKAPKDGKIFLFWNCTASLVKVGDGPNCVFLQRANDFMSRALPRTSDGQAILLVTGDFLLEAALEGALAGRLGIRQVRTDRVLSLPFNYQTVGLTELSEDDIRAELAKFADEETQEPEDEKPEDEKPPADPPKPDENPEEPVEPPADPPEPEDEKPEDEKPEEPATPEEPAAPAEPPADPPKPEEGVEFKDFFDGHKLVDQEGFDAFDWELLAKQDDVVADFTTKELEAAGKFFDPALAKEGKKSLRAAELLAVYNVGRVASDEEVTE